MNASGEAFLPRGPGRAIRAARLAIGNIRTEERHVQRAWEILRAEALRLGALPTHVAGGTAAARLNGRNGTLPIHGRRNALRPGGRVPTPRS